MDARGLAHECRVEATALRSGNAADPSAIAGILEQCATTLEEMDAAAPTLDRIEDKALRVYQRRQSISEPISNEVDYEASVAASMAQDLAAVVMDICAYLKKEKAIA